MNYSISNIYFEMYLHTKVKQLDIVKTRPNWKYYHEISILIHALRTYYRKDISMIIELKSNNKSISKFKRYPFSPQSPPWNSTHLLPRPEN